MEFRETHLVKGPTVSNFKRSLKKWLQELKKNVSLFLVDYAHN